MTTLAPRRRVPAPVGRLARQPWPTADTGRPPCATADTRRPVDPALHDDAVRLADLVRGLLHGTATLRRPDLLDARLRRLAHDAAPLLTRDDRLVDDLRTAAGLAVHALQARPLALATSADFARLARLAELLAALAAACEPEPGAATRRREEAGGWRARRQARADRALFG
ncbi:hypothetical protein [Actinomycetospora sp. NBRC 106378]|uniref:hypothetical protein n=1 Tax=Actinomycetospora sp. NBRC 106378 TaxID=3032208 RepID=UPI0024A0FBB2|nr:hypothetical protein [Actinomycetospora sp. NBRC 106378]GLZ55053.1 hypothetical protein Acsp07_46700 [Actinomycetospora sp. NBRC 106378]